MGQTLNYDKTGKLKNNIVTPKFAGEMELASILDDEAYKALGVCDITCVGVYDTIKKEQDANLMEEVNKRILTKPKKAKTEVELLIEQNKELAKRLEKLEGGKTETEKVETEKVEVEKAEVEKFETEKVEENEEPKLDPEIPIEELRKTFAKLFKKQPANFMKSETMQRKINLKLKQLEQVKK